ncbi:30S ribosomal protein S27ae [Candidatus Woesearchaeota archaeon]|nr:30S ribosomal protein S27ae [Candidatus Woesearchaeota archaeon]
MADKKPAKKKGAARVSRFYAISGDKLTGKRKACPKCGRGVFLAEHKNRLTCGNCHYTEFRK